MFAASAVAAPNVQFVRNHTGGQTKTTGTTVDAALAADVAAGSTLILAVAFDNSGTSTPDVSTISKPGGESASWVRLGGFDSVTATGSSGILGELWAIITTVPWVAASITPVVTLDATRNAKATALAEFTGVTTTLRTATTTNAVINGQPTTTSGGAFSIGDLVIGVGGFECLPTNITGDSDTSNGVWSTLLAVGTTGGLDQSNASAVIQWKKVTGAATQTFNPVGSNTGDAGVILSGLIPA